VKRPDEQEGWAGLGDLAAKNAMTGMPNPRSDPTSMMTYPDRRSASTSVPYSQITRTGTATRVEPPASGVPTLAWRVSLVKCNVMNRIVSRDVMVNMRLCFIGYAPVTKIRI